MYRIPILQLGQFLLVTIQTDLYDKLATNLQTDLTRMVQRSGARGILIDISGLSIVDSLAGATFERIGRTAKMLDADTVVVGMQPAVAITLIELGLELKGVYTALNLDKGMELLKNKISPAA